MTKNAIQVLQSFELFSDLSETECKALHTLMHNKQYSQGHIVFNEGDVGDRMYIIVYGAVAITVNTPDGEKVEIAEISEGNFFGEMSIFDNAKRSATCSAKKETQALSLSSDDFFTYIKLQPEAGMRIMHRMLTTVSSRLQATGAFLSDMVLWGEQARKRAITDDFTGLYNRRFLDSALDSKFAEAKTKKKPLTVIMIDLDHFGSLNNEYGQETGDKIILKAAEAFKKVFRKQDILSRYGGDEFTFLLPDTDGQEALKLCTKLKDELHAINILRELGGSFSTVSASIGIASFPEHGKNAKTVSHKADEAVYLAKEAGRDTAVLFEDKE